MTDDEFGPLEMGRLILDAVAWLHANGFERLRICPGMSASGAYWRVNVGVDIEGMGSAEQHFHYTTGQGVRLGDQEVDASWDAEDMAKHIYHQLGDEGRGSDPAYVAWYRRLLGIVEETGMLPIAYADNMDVEKGWKVGGTRVPVPPEPGASLPGRSSGPDATGARAEAEDPVGNGLPPRIDYAKLNGKQKEIYNFQKLAGLLADYGFNCIKLADDWQGADFLAYHYQGNDTLKVQLKSRVTISSNYLGKDIHMAFPAYGRWYLIAHDRLVDLCGLHTPWLESVPWAGGHYTSQSPSKKLVAALEPYALS